MTSEKDTYLTPDHDFIELVRKYADSHHSGQVHFFNAKGEWDSVEGKLSSLRKDEHGEFVEFEGDDKVRLDKIITIFGKPGPAYEAFDRYGNACLACEDLGQF